MDRGSSTLRREREREGLRVYINEGSSEGSPAMMCAQRHHVDQRNQESNEYGDTIEYMLTLVCLEKQ